VSWAAAFVGLPFVDGGRGPAAFDCWGLVRAVYAARLGVDLPSYGEISARDLARVARAMRGGQDVGWRSVDTPAELDVVLMRPTSGGDFTAHVGVCLGGGQVLHTEPATGSLIMPVTHMYLAGRIRGYRRLAS
jgi:cell wall-associated NlpC family hydrolase